MGKFLNKFIKSHGVPLFEFKRKGRVYAFNPRKWLVEWLCEQLAQIDEENYFRNRNSGPRDKYYWYKEL